MENKNRTDESKNLNLSMVPGFLFESWR